MVSAMPWRIYAITQKYTKVNGSVSIYKVKNRKWIKTNKHKPQNKGLARKLLFSKRFGLLEVYNRKEQQHLICPSGYSISQCFNVMSKLWFGYKGAMNSDKRVEQMKRCKGKSESAKRLGKPGHLRLFETQCINTYLTGSAVHKKAVI